MLDYREFHGYKIYEDGTVIGLQGRPIKIRNNKGRLEVKMNIENDKKIFILPSLMYYLFYGFDISNKNLCVIHKDDNRLNTHIENLALIERKKLIQGEGHLKRSKLTNEQILEIREQYVKSQPGSNQHNGKAGTSLSDLALKYGVTKSNIYHIVKGLTHNEDNYKLKWWRDVRVNKFSQLKEVVQTHSAKEIDGVLIDVQTANAILTVYGALGSDNKEKFISGNIEKMAQVAWKMIEKVSH